MLTLLSSCEIKLPYSGKSVSSEESRHDRNSHHTHKCFHRRGVTSYKSYLFEMRRNSCYGNDIFELEFSHSIGMSAERPQMVCKRWMEIDFHHSKHIKKPRGSLFYSGESNMLFIRPVIGLSCLLYCSGHVVASQSQSQMTSFFECTSCFNSFVINRSSHCAVMR